MYISLIFCNERIKITHKLSIPWNLSYLISASDTPSLTNTGKSALKCTEINCKGIRIWSWYNFKWLIQKAVSLVLFYLNFNSMNECQVFPFFCFSFHQFALPNTKYALLLSSNRWIVSVFELWPLKVLLAHFTDCFGLYGITLNWIILLKNVQKLGNITILNRTATNLFQFAKLSGTLFVVCPKSQFQQISHGSDICG
jgi:hypothetical protein